MPFFGNIGPTELIIVLVIALLVLGPGKLPEVGSALGKSIREFRKAATDVQEAARIDPVPNQLSTPARPANVVDAPGPGSDPAAPTDPGTPAS